MNKFGVQKIISIPQHIKNHPMWLNSPLYWSDKYGGLTKELLKYRLEKMKNNKLSQLEQSLLELLEELYVSND